MSVAEQQWHWHSRDALLPVGGTPFWQTNLFTVNQSPECDEPVIIATREAVHFSRVMLVMLVPGER